MGRNLIIEKTSSEEGRYAEVITKFYYDNYLALGGENEKYINMRLIDTTKEPEFQKIDCDFYDKVTKTKIETKNDTWIAGKKKSKTRNYPNGTGNITYEFATHVPKYLINKIEAYLSKNDNVTLLQVLENFPELHDRYIGCNEKCEVNHIFLVGSEEESPENRKYKVKKIWTVKNKIFKTYARKSLISEIGKFYFRYQEEDKAYNAMILIPIDSLIEKDIAHEIPEHMFNNLMQMIPQLSEYHTSQEIENLLK